MSDSCDLTDCSPPGFSVHRDSPDKNTGVGCHGLLQGIFLLPRLLHLLHWQAGSLPLALPGKSKNLICYFYKYKFYWYKECIAHNLNIRIEYSVQLLSCAPLFATAWTTAFQASLSFMICQSSLKVMSVESVMLSNNLILCCPLLLLPSIFPIIRVFSYELALYVRWSKYWSFSFSISPSYEYSGLISFNIDWFDLLPVQGALKSLLHTTFQKHQFLGTQHSCGPTLTSIHDSWKNHSYRSCCQQSDVSAYLRLLIFLLAILIPAVIHPALHSAWWTLHIS